MSPRNRTNLYFKVVVEHGPEEKPERLAEEIRQRLMKLYGVRRAELSSLANAEE
jgi:hypothetical protein